MGGGGVGGGGGPGAMAAGAEMGGGGSHGRAGGGRLPGSPLTGLASPIEWDSGDGMLGDLLRDYHETEGVESADALHGLPGSTQKIGRWTRWLVLGLLILLLGAGAVFLLHINDMFELPSLPKEFRLF